jgi:hypothetical protein
MSQESQRQFLTIAEAYVLVVDVAGGVVGSW